MNKIPPSSRIKQAIHELLEAGLQGDTSILSELLSLGAQHLVQEIVEQEVIDFLGRDHYEHRGKGEPFTGYRNVYRPKEVRTAEGAINISGSSLFRMGKTNYRKRSKLILACWDSINGNYSLQDLLTFM